MYSPALHTNFGAVVCLFQDRVFGFLFCVVLFLYSSSCPGTCATEQNDLVYCPTDSASQVLGLKAFPATPGLQCKSHLRCFTCMYVCKCVCGCDCGCLRRLEMGDESPEAAVTSSCETPNRVLECEVKSLPKATSALILYVFSPASPDMNTQMRRSQKSNLRL